MRKLANLVALFVISLLAVSLVSASHVGTESDLGGLTEEGSTITVEVNDELVQDDGNLLVVEEGERLEIEVELRNNGTVDAEGIEVVARLSGYEYSNSLQDSTDLFDVRAGTRRTVRLQLDVPRDIDNGDNTLRVQVLDRNSAPLTREFPLSVESPRNAVEIVDVSLSPGTTVRAGRAVLATVVLENFGERDAEDVKVTVSIPALGVSATEFVDELDADDREDVPEVFLPIPVDAAAGDYEVAVRAEYRGFDAPVKRLTLTVQAAVLPQAQDKLVVAAGPEVQALSAGQAGTFAIALTNSGSVSKAYVLEAVAGEWASTQLSESLVVLNAGENKVVYLEVTPAAGVSGEKQVVVSIKSGDEVLESFNLRANVQSSDDGTSKVGLRSGVEIALIVVVLLLVIVGLIIGFSRMKKDDGEEEKTYY